MGIFRVGL